MESSNKELKNKDNKNNDNYASPTFNVKLNYI